MRVPGSVTLADIQSAFREVNQRLDQFDGTRNIDLNGRRIINAGSSVQGQDYIRQDELADLLQQVAPSTSSGVDITVGAHSARVATPATTNGSIFYESDRTTAYIAIDGKWKYAFGMMTKADMTTIPADLTADDTGFLFHVDLYNHTLMWLGNFLKWTFAPGDEGSGFVRNYYVAPTQDGWHHCNGDTVTWLHVDIGLANGWEEASLTLPNENGNSTYHESGPFDGVIYPAVAPGVSSTALSVNGPGGFNADQFATVVVDNGARPPHVIVERFFRL